MTKSKEKAAAALWIRLAKCYGLVLNKVRAGGRNGTTLPQFDVLAQLLRHHPDGMTMVALSRALLVTAGNVTHIVKRLQARGLVTVKPDPGDRRVKNIKLTARGKRLAEAEVERHERLLADIFRDLPAPEAEQIGNVLERLRGALVERAGARPGSGEETTRARSRPSIDHRRAP